MTISLLKSKDSAPARPALAALRAHLAEDAEHTRNIADLVTRHASAVKDIRAAEALAERITAERDAIDQVLADERYRDRPAPDMTAEKQQLAALENEYLPLSQVARVGKLVATQLHDEMLALRAKREAMKPQTDRLLWEAAIEEAVSLAPEYIAASDRMRAAAHNTFAALAAADKIAKSRHYGEFFGSGLYADLYIPLPAHSAYRRSTLTAEAAQAIRREDCAAIDIEADQLINRLLNGEG